MIKSTMIKGIKVLYDLYYYDELPFVMIREITYQGVYIDLSLAEEENIKAMLYNQEHLANLFEELGNRVSANFWRNK